MKHTTTASFGSLVEECGKVGISRTVAFKLSQDGSLRTFTIGKRRYVYLDSLRALPETLAKQKGVHQPRRSSGKAR